MGKTLGFFVLLFALFFNTDLIAGQVTVTPNSGAGGAISPITPQVINSGDSIVFNATPTTGFTLDKWYVNGAPNSTTGLTLTLTAVAADTNVLVTFKDAVSPTVTYTVTAAVNGKVDFSGAVTIPLGGSKIFTATPDTGYVVDTWYLNATATLPQTPNTFQVTNAAPNGALVVTFKPSLTTYTYGIFSGSNGKVDPSGAAVAIAKNGPLVLTASPVAGFEVDQWYVNSVAQDQGKPSITITATQDKGSVLVTFKSSSSVGFAPNITSSVGAVGIFGDDKFSFSLAGTGSPAPTFKVANPTQLAEFGLMLSGNVIAGKPTKVGTVVVALVATNGLSPDAFQSLTITIVYPPGFVDPVKLIDGNLKAALIKHTAVSKETGFGFNTKTKNAKAIFEAEFPSSPAFGSALTPEQAEKLFTREKAAKEREAMAFMGKTAYDDLPEPLKEVVINNLFQGIYIKEFFPGSKLGELKRAYKKHDFVSVYILLLGSPWVQQNKDRAKDLIELAKQSASLGGVIGD